MTTVVLANGYLAADSRVTLCKASMPDGRPAGFMWHRTLLKIRTTPTFAVAGAGSYYAVTLLSFLLPLLFLRLFSFFPILYFGQTAHLHEGVSLVVAWRWGPIWGMGIRIHRFGPLVVFQCTKCTLFNHKRNDPLLACGSGTDHFTLDDLEKHGPVRIFQKAAAGDADTNVDIALFNLKTWSFERLPKGQKPRSLMTSLRLALFALLGRDTMEPPKPHEYFHYNNRPKAV